MTKTFGFYQEELSRIKSALEMLSRREDSEKVGVLRDELLDEVIALANEIVGMRCRDLSELRAKALFIRELCEPSDIDGALVFSLCRDIEVMLPIVKKAIPR